MESDLSIASSIYEMENHMAYEVHVETHVWTYDCIKTADLPVITNGSCRFAFGLLASWHPHCSLLSLGYSRWDSVSPWPGKGWKGKEVFTL